MAIETTRQPNVILVLTDDQGYPDLGCTGNPRIHTPNIDAFSAQAVRFSDFHVQPLCTPTRGAIMTGHRPVRNGAWATCWGRSILRRTELTMADVFAHNGYSTGMFGKWHLGDNYPYRPQDRGFQTVVAHKGGGVGQTPDFWGNNYFNDTYFHNGKPVGHDGYCTDIWFGEAMRFIEEHKERPFFCYIATNAPHAPYYVAAKYRRLYEGRPEIPAPGFYGMITNIDENFGYLRECLSRLGLEENTILIFMTDNGSSGGARVDRQGFVTQGYNAGMRGMKGSFYDGGHRVPFFIRWPAGGLPGVQDIGELALDVDLLPTFIDLCGLEPPVGVTFDGTSLAPLLRGECTWLPGERVHVLQNRQSTELPPKWHNAVMTRRWRLIHGAELYDIKADPGQRHNVASERPDVVARLHAAFEGWWDEISPRLEEYCPIVLGNDAENPTCLSAMDVMGDVAWNQHHIVMAQKSTGSWRVEVECPGDYRISLRRWPQERDLAIDGCIGAEEVRAICSYVPELTCRTIHPVQARLQIYDTELVQPVGSDTPEVTFRLTIEKTGVTDLHAWFVGEDHETQGAYYVYVERL